MTDYIPRPDAQVLSFAQNYSTKISAAAADYHVSPAEAAELAGAVAAFAQAYSLSADPATRTRPKIIQKDENRKLLVALLRRLSGKIQAHDDIAPALKLELGLPLRSRTPTTVPAPASKPLLHLAGEDACRHIVRICDEQSPTRLAKPRRTIGAQVFVYIGDNPPQDLSKWSLRGIATRGTMRIEYAESDIGKRAHIAAR